MVRIVKPLNKRYYLHMEKRIEELLEQIRPQLALHGGNIEFVSFDDRVGTLFVKMSGACEGCPMVELTLKSGIESFLQEHLPEIKEVLAVD